MSFRAAALVCLFALVAADARAQQVLKLEFKDGRVTLHAKDAPVRSILAEWARLGGATIVNGDRVPGLPMTLELVAVPERQALDTLLRNVAAYMLAPRRPGTTGVSMFDRILILPTSTPPRVAPPTTVAGGARPLPRPPVAFPRPPLPQPQVVQLPQAEEATADDDASVPGAVPGPNGVAAQPGNVTPQPAVVRPGMPAGFSNGAVPVGPAIELPSADEPPAQPVVTGTGTAPGAGNPFGVPAGSSSRPGVIAPAPQQPQPNQPRTP